MVEITYTLWNENENLSTSERKRWKNWGAIKISFIV